MASESERIRKLMDLLEGSSQPQILNEGWIQNLKNKRLQRLGSKERQKMAGRLKEEWLKWLGQTGRDGTMEDMERFMSARIGFTADDIKTVMGRALPDSEPSDDNTDEEVHDKQIARGVPEQGSDTEEDGHPISDDLDTKLSDYGKVGTGDKWADAKVHEVDPKTLMTNNDYDEKKIRQAMANLKPGEVLKYGQRRRMKGPQTESIVEAASDVLDSETVDNIFDRCAAHVNDAYLLDGPRNDQVAAAADAAEQKTASGGYKNDRGKMPSGSYDPKEIDYTLINELDLPRDKIRAMTSHVAKAEVTGEGYARMQKSDIDVLARIGYAFLKSRS